MSTETVAKSTLVVRAKATCRLCGGEFTRNDPPMNYGKVTVEGCLTTDSYQGIAHRMCVELGGG